MSQPAISTTIENVRRLAITNQHLAGESRSQTPARAILSVVHDLGCIQLDPINVVAPSHLIVLWSRIGRFRLSELDRLLWDRRSLFEYWAHQSSIVATEDYPLYYSMMKRYPDSFPKPWGAPWKERVRKWLSRKAELRRTVLRELKGGPLLLRQFQDHSRTRRKGSGWSSGSDVTSMLFHLQMKGEVMVVGHQGNQKLWGLSKGFLPKGAEKRVLPDEELEYEAVQRSIRALGVATIQEIEYYFLRGRYRNLKRTLERLDRDSRIRRVVVRGLADKSERYVHDQDVARLDSMDSSAWRPKVTLLSPFDNLICDRARTQRIFDFDYKTEIYVPRNKRRFGYYVLPILFGDRLVGRIDPRMDREGEKLIVNSVHAEPGAPGDAAASRQIGEVIGEFGEFLGAKEVVYTTRVPRIWKRYLH